MPRRKKAPRAVKTAGAKRVAGPSLSDGIFYSLIIALFVVFISGAYHESSGCTSNCIGENIANGYPYAWFIYNTYNGWQSGSINWLGGILDIAFWAFITFVIMLVLNAAIKEF